MIITIAQQQQKEMSKVQIDNISIANPKSKINEPIHFNITFSAIDRLKDQLLWKIIYVGSAFTEDYDQILEEFQIGSINEASTLSFEVECPAPDYGKVPSEELICTTAMIISVAYKEQEFIRIGYYIHNLYTGEAEDLTQLSLEEIVKDSERTIICEKPRITKFEIKWDADSEKNQKEKPQDNREIVNKVTQENLQKQKKGLQENERQGEEAESAQKNETDG